MDTPRPKKEYAHMCRMEHEQIGHNDSEHEQCPLCRALGQLAQRDALLRGIRDKAKLSSTHHIHISDGEMERIEKVLK